jgi:hypothetical protein
LRGWLLTFCLMTLFIMSTMPLLAAAENKVVIVAIPRLMLEDISERTPNLLEFVRTSAVGMMTQSRLGSPVRIYQAWNSGMSLRPSRSGPLFMDAAEIYRGQPVAQLYRALTGFSISSDGAVHIGFPQLYQINSSNAAYLGRVGALLHEASLKTAAIGNCDIDTLDTLDRSSSAMLMDDRGRIDYGAVGSGTNLKDPDFPAGTRSDPQQILTYWQSFNRLAQVILITLGDLERLEAYSNNLTEIRWNHYRRLTLNRYDRLFGELLKQIDGEKTLTVLFTTLPPSRERRRTENAAAPVIIHGPDFDRGLLTYDWNWQKGHVSANDSAVTVLHFLGIAKPSRFDGAELRRVPGDWKRLLLNRVKFPLGFFQELA